MPVYFVYRCHYGAPGEKHLRRFEHDSVLAWARDVWRQFDTTDAAYPYARDLLGGLEVYSFGGLFHADPEDGSQFPRPETMAHVRRWFGAMYDPTIVGGPHHVQVLTDDDEIDMAVIVFDGHYCEANPGKADFLLLPDWELPGGSSDGPPPDLSDLRTEAVEPRGTGDGVLYVFHEDVQGEYLRDKNECDRCARVEGVRLPDLARHLLCTADEEDQEYALRELRDLIRGVVADPAGGDAGFLLAIRDQPDEATHWDAYSDWLAERDLPPAGLHLLDRALRQDVGYQGANRNHAFDRVKVTPHMAQLCRHDHRWHVKPMTDAVTMDDEFEQFILFDDRWAAAHPTLARGILTFASRWDVLT